MDNPKDNLKAQLKYTLSKHKGYSNPITAKQLALIFRKDERIIRLLIRELISEGLPIASRTELPAGYFLITNFNEANRYANSIKGRLIEDAIRRRDFKRSASLYLGQVVQGRLL